MGARRQPADANPCSDRDGERPRDRGLSKDQRITESNAFQEMFADADRVAGRLMVLWSRDTEGPAVRLGAVAGRKTFRRAVDRNRARRRMREAFRRRRDALTPGHDVMIVARRRILDASTRDIERELTWLVSKSGLLAEREGKPKR